MALTDWFVIQTNPNCEKKAALELRRIGIRAYIPTRHIEYRHRMRRETAVKSRPLLIGYLFVRFTAESADAFSRPNFGAARGCDGVKNFVRVANQFGEWVPFSVPHRIIADFMRRQRKREFGSPEVANRDKRMLRLRETFPEGSVIRVADGPFQGFLAILKRLTDTGKLEVELSGESRTIKLCIDAASARPIAQIGEAA